MHTPGKPEPRITGNTRAISSALANATYDPFFDGRRVDSDPRRRRPKFITVSVSRRSNTARIYA